MKRRGPIPKSDGNRIRLQPRIPEEIFEDINPVASDRAMAVGNLAVYYIILGRNAERRAAGEPEHPIPDWLAREVFSSDSQQALLAS